MAKFKIIECRNCHEDYVGHYASKYCSEECKKEYHAKPKKTVLCLYCGEFFETTRDDKKYCNPEHKRLHEKELYDKNKVVETKVCAYEKCDVEFTDVPKKKYCCRDHARKAKKH